MTKRLYKILFTIILFLILLPFVHAEDTQYDRKSIPNYGVNKKWKINEKNINNVLNTPKVDSSKKIYDYANILTDEEEEKLYEEFSTFIDRYKTELVFVSIDMPYTVDKQNEDYAADFYDYNDFGIEFDKYNGILLLRNNYENDKYFNVYMFGNAQLYISYNRAESILDSIYSSFVNSNYYEGISLFRSRVESYYYMGVASEMKNYIVDDNGYLKKIFVLPYLSITIISGIITLIVIIILIKKNKMIVKKVEASEFIKKIVWNKKEDIFLHSHTSTYVVSHDSGGHSGGSYHSSSGSSGGGHSSGGGRHG